MGSDKRKIAEITLKGQKSTGKYQNWLNIKNTRGNSKSSILEGDEDLDNLYIILKIKASIKMKRSNYLKTFEAIDTYQK